MCPFFIRKAISLGCVKVDGQLVVVPKGKRIGVRSNRVRVSIRPQRIGLDIVYEDVYIIAIDKASDIILHPGFGNDAHTMLNGLLYYYTPTIGVPRAGIVHRLDKDTTGILLIAKGASIYVSLVEELRFKRLIREYEGVVVGCLLYSGSIVKPIVRNSVKRICMRAANRGKASITNYLVKERFPFHTRLRVVLGTGRTHQVRTHMVYVRHPFVGDITYGKDLYSSYTYMHKLKEPKQQVLHAIKLVFMHPVTLVRVKLEPSLAYGILGLLEILRES